VHELSLALALLESAEVAIPAGSRVKSVKVVVGALSGADPLALARAWELVARGTRLEEARLDIDEVSARLRCPNCHQDFQPELIWRLVCPGCQTPSQQLLQGRELRVDWLEVVDESPDC